MAEEFSRKKDRNGHVSEIAVSPPPARVSPTTGNTEPQDGIPELWAGIQVAHNFTLPVDETPDTGLTKCERGSYEQP